MTRKFKTGLMGSCAVFVLQIAGALPASAQGYCNSVTGTGLNLSCARTISNANFGGAASPASIWIDPVIGKQDGLVWDSDWIAGTGERRFRSEGDILFPRSIYTSWENIYFGSTRTDGKRTAVDVVALKRGTILTDNRSITLEFDRLTLENTALTLKDAASPDGRQTGQIEYLSLGQGVFGRGGGLTLRNSSLTFEDSTKLLMNSPGAPVFILAESGDNELTLGSQKSLGKPLKVEINDGASLTFTGTSLTPGRDGNLTIGNGAKLALQNNSILYLTENDGSGLARSTIDGGEVVLDGQNTELRLTAPLLTDSRVSLDNGATLRIQKSNNSDSTLRFEGNNALTFNDAQSSVFGSVVNRDGLTLEVGKGTTVVESLGKMDKSVGLGADKIFIEEGTLDISRYDGLSEFYVGIETLEVTRGGSFVDEIHFYDGLKTLNVSNGTLQTHSQFGTLNDSSPQLDAKISNGTIELFLSKPTSSLSPGLAALAISARTLEFSGDNRVNIGISPAGECLKVSGNCVPGTTRYSGELVTNVGKASAPKLDGFDTVLFVPNAIDTTATAADYVSGGKNGIYTVARHNVSTELDGAVTHALYDAAPRTPTVSDLFAAGSNLPANLTYAIVNDPVADNRVDISFVDLTLQNHTSVTPNYTPQFTNAVIVDPDPSYVSSIAVTIVPDPITDAGMSWEVVEPQTDQVSTLSVSIKPEAVDSGIQTWEVVEPDTEVVTTYSLTVTTDPLSGIKQEIITTTVTEPDGEVIGTDTYTVPLDQTGSKIKVITTAVTEPNGDLAFTDTVTVPLDGPDAGTQVFQEIVTEPTGDLIVTSSVAVPLDPDNSGGGGTNVTPQFTNNVIVDPNPERINSIAVTIVPDPITDAGKSWQVVEPQTNQVSTLSVSVKPDAVGSGVQNWEVVEPKSELVTTYSLTVQTDPQTGIKQEIITTTVTEPDGEVVGTDTHTVPLDQTGSKIKVITTTVTEPNGDIAFTDTVTVPLDGPDAGTQVIHQIVTEPNGDQIVTSSVAVPLDPAKGTTNTQNLGNLVDKGKVTLPHSAVVGIETLHPEVYASYMTVALEHSDHLRNMVLLNARGQASGGDRVEGLTDSGRRIWMDSALMRGNVERDAQADLAGFNYDLGEIVVGTDLWSDGTSNIGAYIGFGRYSMSEFTSATQALNFSSTAYHVGAYGTHDIPSWSFTGMAGFSWASTEATREAVTGLGANTHKADFDSQTFEAAIRAEYTGFRPNSAWRLSPEVGLGYAYYRQDEFTESGSRDTALTIKEATAESLIGSFGLNLAGPEFAGGLEPLGFIRYEHDFLASRDSVHDIDASFASAPGTSQSFVGTHRGPDAVSFGLGFKSAAGSSVDVSAGIVYTKNSYGDEYGGGISMNWSF